MGALPASSRGAIDAPASRGADDPGKAPGSLSSLLELGQSLIGLQASPASKKTPTIPIRARTKPHHSRFARSAQAGLRGEGKCRKCGRFLP
jgi:hypothetical protein